MGILLTIIVLAPTAYYVFLYAVDKISKFLLRKAVREACDRIWPKLAENQAFLQHAEEIFEETGGNHLMTEELAWRILTSSKIVIKLADAERDKRIAEKEKKGEKSLMIRDDVLNGLSFALNNAWHDTRTQNVLVNKLKKKNAE